MKLKIFSIVFLLCCVQCILAKVYLVSIGIADYPSAKYDLRVSANDAKTIADIFLATKDASVSILINERATRSEVLNTMKSTFSNAKKDDEVIFYFSGHGISGALVCYDSFLYYDDIFNILRTSSASKKIIITDACFSGKMRNNKQQKRKFQSEDIMFFLSSRTTELSLESKYRNSLFTIFLERGLRGGADTNHDRIITAYELYRFVHSGVTKASKKSQHPVMWGRFNHDMPIIKW